ncbi:unnamed protein product [Adineta steineri]|uniref:Uncharacterized protein n=1 Tax=Adineta steineri TaxID=433720 RepID=A0A814HJC5_9BILA|nr:unnamed protein product [Adineta steineri]
MFPTPDLSHFKRNDYNEIYEPDADSFLLLDALELKLNKILEQKPFIILEFGCGSGLATTFIAKHFCPVHKYYYFQVWLYAMTMLFLSTFSI